jgi:hypothetical protein
MSKKMQEKEFEGSFFAKPEVGSLFTILSGLALLVLMMILPLVGPAAAHGSGSPGAYQAPWYGKNVATFLGFLCLAFVLAALAVVSKLERRKVDQSPLPWYSIGLCAGYVILLIAFLTGALGA